MKGGSYSNKLGNNCMYQRMCTIKIQYDILIEREGFQTRKAPANLNINITYILKQTNPLKQKLKATFGCNIKKMSIATIFH